MKRYFLLWVLLIDCLCISAQTIDYPYQVNYLQLTLEGKEVQMAYMDVKPSRPNGEAVVLFHGKNFNGFYWKDVIPPLLNAGYRVVVPDQVGWGKSSKPVLHYNFFMLAHNTKILLDSLAVHNIHVVGHSMGGMVAIRFALMFPKVVTKLVLENPIGLEDYSAFVPYRPLDQLYANELSATYASIKNYQKSYYPVWKESYEPYVKAQAYQLQHPDYDKIAYVNALTYQMIYEQPVVHQIDSLKVPMLLIIGQLDRTVVGKALLSEQQKKIYGQYPMLGEKVRARIKDAQLVELADVGHIPHIQQTNTFMHYLLPFLQTPQTNNKSSRGTNKTGN